MRNERFAAVGNICRRRMKRNLSATHRGRGDKTDHRKIVEYRVKLIGVALRKKCDEVTILKSIAEETI